MVDPLEPARSGDDGAGRHVRPTWVKALIVLVAALLLVVLLLHLTGNGMGPDMHGSALHIAAALAR